MIAVISDSHIPGRAVEIPDEFLETLEEADIIVHCGDFETEEVYEQIKQYGKVIAVKGNCERFELPKYEKFEENDIEFGVTHGTGINPRGHGPTLANIADQMKVEVLLHGHTHQQEAAKEDGKILLNPGSCTGVGGGSSVPGNPKMMIIEPGIELEVCMIELEKGEFKIDTKRV